MRGSTFAEFFLKTERAESQLRVTQLFPRNWKCYYRRPYLMQNYVHYFWTFDVLILESKFVQRVGITFLGHSHCAALKVQKMVHYFYRLE